VDSDKLELQARIASIIVKTLLILLLGAQVYLKSSLEPLWTLYYALQIMCYLKIYDSPFPANV